MTRYQILLLPAVAAAVIVLSGALNHPPAASPAPLPAASAASDPEALKLLDQAAAAYAPERVSWLETKIWQRSRCEDFAYQACGRMLIAPGDRSRFDLNVQVSNVLGELRIINDGQTLWQSVRIGGQDAGVKRWDLPVQNETLTTAEAVARARAQFLRTQGMNGLAPILRSLRQSVQNPQICRTSWNGQEVAIVSAGWPESTATPGGTELVQPRVAISQCRIYLDAVTLWPYRLEWWGAAKPGKPAQMVMETEYREPVLNQAMTAERCTGEFAFAAN